MAETKDLLVTLEILKAVHDSVNDKLDEKTAKTRIDFDGTKFTMNGSVLNYKQLHDIHLTNPDFAFVVYGDRAYLLSYVQDDPARMREMRFESVIATTDSNLSFVKTSGIYVKSSDGVNIAGVDLTDINSENKAYKATVIDESHKNDIWYPSVKAVTDYIGTTIDDVAELNNVLFTEKYFEYKKTAEFLTRRKGYITSGGTLSDSEAYEVYYFTATNDFKMYADKSISTLFRIGIYSDDKFSGAASIIKYYVNESIPTLSNPILVKQGQVVAVNANIGVSYDWSIYVSKQISLRDEYQSDIAKLQWQVKKIGDSITIKDKDGYGANFTRFGCNNLMHLRKWLLGETEQIMTSDTIGPYNVRAINNIDGDADYANGFWTGGIHGYNGSTSESANHTAKLIRYELYCDNTKITEDGDYTAKNVTLICVNNVQANNTCKRESEGRYVLQEEITYSFNSDVGFNVVNKIIPLEEIMIIQYYGLQLGSFADGTITVYGDAEVKTIDNRNSHGNVEIHSGARPFAISGENNNGCVTMMLHPVGLGCAGWNQSVTALIASNGKAYYYAIYYNSPDGKNVIFTDPIFISGRYIIGKKFHT